MMLVRKKKFSVFAVAAVAAGLSLTACGSNGTDVASPSQAGSSSSASTPPAAPATTAGKSATSGASEKGGSSCTDRMEYADDPRSNAEINSIGERTGHCPAPEKAPEQAPEQAPDKKSEPAGTAKKAGSSCTNQINYAGDSRSNAEINSIGEDTGYCPPVKH